MKLLHLVSVAVLWGSAAIAGMAPAIAQSSPTPETAGSELSCLSGMPDGTYQGDRPVTRYEFAAGLNACLDRVLQQLEQNDLATQAEFQPVLQRQQELNEQLQELSGQLEPSSLESVPLESPAQPQDERPLP